jgi:hypothetical protein
MEGKNKSVRPQPGRPNEGCVGKWVWDSSRVVENLVDAAGEIEVGV